MISSPKRRTLLLRVTTCTPSIGLGRAPPGTSLHSPTEGRYTSVEARFFEVEYWPPVTSNTWRTFTHERIGVFYQNQVEFYPFVITGQETGASMISSFCIESRAEVLNPPLFSIPGHSSEGILTSSHQNCVCVRVWYWACPPVMWRWSANVTSYLSLTLYYVSEEMMRWLYCCHVVTSQK